MRPLVLLLPVVVAAAIPATAAASDHVFNVSAYGVQRYERHTIEQAPPQPTCYDGKRGDTTEHTVGRFHTEHPIRVRVAGDGSLVVLSSRNRFPLRVDASYHNTMDGATESYDCVREQWLIDPVPIGGNCDAATSSTGFGFSPPSVAGDRVALAAGDFDAGTDTALFAGCEWGDRSAVLYPAKGRIPRAQLVDGTDTQVVLRGRERTVEQIGYGGSVTTTKKTTVYLRFKPRR